MGIFDKWLVEFDHLMERIFSMRRSTLILFLLVAGSLILYFRVDIAYIVGALFPGYFNDNLRYEQLVALITIIGVSIILSAFGSVLLFAYIFRSPTYSADVSSESDHSRTAAEEYKDAILREFSTLKNLRFSFH
jgi:hypothetical protein